MEKGAGLSSNAKEHSSNSQDGFAGSEFTARAELVEAHSPFDKLRANGKFLSRSPFTLRQAQGEREISKANGKFLK